MKRVKICFMSERVVFLFLTLLVLSSTSFAQQKDNTLYRENTPTNTFLVGGGFSFFGLNAKSGIFVGNNLLLGINGETHNLLSTRKEVGIFGRKYINKNRLSFFAEMGASYGSFQIWDLDIDHEKPDTEFYKELKLNGGLGAEIRLTPKISIEGAAGMGKIMNGGWWAPSLRSSVNYRFTR